MLIAVRFPQHWPLGEIAVERDVAVDDMPRKMQRQVIDMPAAASPVEDIERQRIGEAFDLDEQQRAADIDILIRAVDFGDRVAGRAVERSGELEGARFFAGFSVAGEGALVVYENVVGGISGARSTVVFGSVKRGVGKE